MAAISHARNAGPVGSPAGLVIADQSAFDLGLRNVLVSRSPAVLLQDPPSREVLVTWTIGQNGFALVVNERDSTHAQVARPPRRCAD